MPRRRIELRTFCLQDRRSTTKATRAVGICQFSQPCVRSPHPCLHQELLDGSVAAIQGQKLQTRRYGPTWIRTRVARVRVLCPNQLDYETRAGREAKTAASPRMASLSPWAWSGIFLVALTATLAAWFLWQQRGPRALTPAAARAALRHKTVHAVVDVRTDAEWAGGHYPDAIHIPLQTIVTALPKQIPDRNVSIMFYCRTGHRAAVAARLAQDLGYTNVWYLSRGDWQDLEPRAKILTV